MKNTAETTVLKRFKPFILGKCSHCDEDIPIRPTTKGNLLRYKNGHNATGVPIQHIRKGDKHYRWKGGIGKTIAGYVTMLRRHHPNADKCGRVVQHRYWMELEIGRYLRPDEEIDHINGDKEDNRIENLRILAKAEHTRRHVKGQPGRRKGKPNKKRY